MNLILTPKGLRLGIKTLPCTIGRQGLSTWKSEGDNTTPVGRHKIVGMLYRPDRIMKPTDWAVPIRKRDAWSDDPLDPDYNMMVNTPHEFSHERLFRSDAMYDLVIITNWNWPYAIKNRGSAIFIHAWKNRGVPTAGCIALSKGHLLWLATKIRYQTELIIPALSSSLQK